MVEVALLMGAMVPMVLEVKVSVTAELGAVVFAVVVTVGPFSVAAETVTLELVVMVEGD